jgi:uncharacterized protein involved in type VI secretion and phage assembly
MFFQTFLEHLILDGLEHFRKFYGVYRGVVTDNNDPEKRGRILAHVPSAGQERAPDIWIDPAFPAAGTNRGMFWPPEKGDSVRVAFDNGDPSNPSVYWGGWFGAPGNHSEVPTELKYSDNGYPERRGFVTRMGHSLSFVETAGQEAIELVWHKPAAGDKALTNRSKTADRSLGAFSSIKLTSSGSIVIENKNKSKIEIDTISRKIQITDENKNVVTLDAKGATIKASPQINLDSNLIVLATGANTPAVRGQDLMTWLASHTHGTAVGPSSPPLVPPTPTILSQNVRLK